MFLTDCNLAFLAVLNCNNCTRYVLNQLRSMYYGCYTTKHTKENEKALVELIRALNAYEDKLNAAKARANQEEINGSNSSATTEKSDWSIGYSRLLVATRASTNGETIGASLAAFLARGNHLFQMSHETAPLLLLQALAFLNGNHLNASINKNGIIMAAVFDYVYRTTDDPSFSLMNMWVFVVTQEQCLLSKSTRQRKDDDNMSDEYDRVLEDDDNNKNGTSYRTQHRFQPSHPLYATHGHRERYRHRWPKYSAKTLPDILDLDNEKDIMIETRDEKRELYAQGVLIMFVSYRTLSDLQEEWDT